MVDRQYAYVHAHMRRRTGEGLISVFTWSTDDMRMRIATGAGLIHVHVAGVGLIAWPLTLKLNAAFRVF